MRIAIDLIGTLIPETEPFACERQNQLAAFYLPSGPRLQASALLRDLEAANHWLTLYSDGPFPEVAIRRWCKFNQLPFHEYLVISPNLPAIWPPPPGQDIVIDDSPLNIELARYYGAQGVLVSHTDTTWTDKVYQAILERDRSRRLLEHLEPLL